MASVVQLTQLTLLDMNGCVGISDTGVMLLARLPRLAVLEMAWCLRITAGAIRALQACPALTSLNVNGCQMLGAPGLEALGALTQLETLNVLNLGLAKPCLTDASLAQLQMLSNLKSLSVGGMQLAANQVTNAGIIAALRHHPHLTQVSWPGWEGGRWGGS